MSKYLGSCSSDQFIEELYLICFQLRVGSNQITPTLSMNCPSIKFTWPIRELAIQLKDNDRLEVRTTVLELDNKNLCPAGMQVMLTGIQELIEANSHYNLSTWERIWLVSVMATVILSKIGLFLYCRTFQSGIVQTYAMVIMPLLSDFFGPKRVE